MLARVARMKGKCSPQGTGEMCAAAKHFLPTAEHDQSHAQPCRLRWLPAASMHVDGGRRLGQSAHQLTHTRTHSALAPQNKGTKEPQHTQATTHTPWGPWRRPPLRPRTAAAPLPPWPTRCRWRSRLRPAQPQQGCVLMCWGGGQGQRVLRAMCAKSSWVAGKQRA